MKHTVMFEHFCLKSVFSVTNLNLSQRGICYLRPCGLGFYRFGFYRFGQKTKIIGSVHKASLSVRFELGSVLYNEKMQCHSHETNLKPVLYCQKNK